MREAVGGELTQHLIARHVGPGDSEGRIGVTVISIYGQLPVVDAPREADAREDHAVLVALAGRAHRVLGYGHLLRYAGRAGGPRKPRHCERPEDTLSLYTASINIPRTGNPQARLTNYTFRHERWVIECRVIGNSTSPPHSMLITT